MKTSDKPGLVPGDGKVVVAFEPVEVRVYPCEVEAWYAANRSERHSPSGYFQGGTEDNPLPNFHGTEA